MRYVEFNATVSQPKKSLLRRLMGLSFTYKIRRINYLSTEEKVSKKKTKSVVIIFFLHRIYTCDDWPSLH